MHHYSETTSSTLLDILEKFEKLKESEKKGEIETTRLRNHVKEGAQSALSFAEAVGDLSFCGNNHTTTRRIKSEIERHVLEELKSFLVKLKSHVETCNKLSCGTQRRFRDIKETASALAKSCKDREKSARNKKRGAVAGGVAGTAATVVGGVALTVLTGGVGLALIGAGCAVAAGIVIITAAALYDVFANVEQRAKEVSDILGEMGHISSHMLGLIQELEETVTQIERERGTVEGAEIKQHFRVLAETFDALCKVFNDNSAALDQAIQELREVNEKIQNNF